MKKQIAIVSAILVLTLASSIYGCHASLRRSAISTALTWGRLAPLPETAQRLTVKTGGSAFSRSFRIQFTTLEQDIARWLALSDGTKEATPEKATASTRRFIIKPGSGAQHAEVIVDDAKGKVEIYVYWS